MSVVETNIQVPNDGKFILAAKATPIDSCWWSYEYALYNMNSDRAAKKFTVPLPTDLSSGELANIQNSAGFHDINYHSGEPYSGTDWMPPTVVSGSITWATDSFSTNANANALRWGTLYNFRFQANRAPNYSSTVTIGLFKTGTPLSVTGVSVAPAPAGACCTGSACSVSTETCCTSQGGAFKGVYTGCQDCDANGVPDACEGVDTGACCLSGSPNDCVMTATSACCYALNGLHWYGLLSECATIDCSVGPMGPQQGP